MKLSKIILALAILASFSSNSFAQGFGKAIDDGAGQYASELAKFHSANVGNLLKRTDFEPFTVSFFGWRALTITRLPFNKLEGGHLNITRLALSLYDKELDAMLQTIAARPTAMTSFVEATPAEKDAIQKFVVQKYGGKYLIGLKAITATNSKEVPAKMDETAAWKYNLGAIMGELSGSVVKWYAFPNNAKYDEAISGYLLNLDKEIKNAPKDTPPDLLTNLRNLAAFSSKKFFAPTEREQIGAAIKQSLMATMGFAKPLPAALENFAKTVDQMNSTTPKPTPTTTDAAKAKEVAEQYRQQGVTKRNNKLYDPAIDDFDRAAAADPNNARIYSERGRTYFAKGDTDKAIADFTKAINLGGITAEDYYYLNDRAGAYYRKGDADAAMADVNQAISLNAKNVYGYYLRGFIHRVRGNTAQAKVDFQAALTIDPNYQLAKTELAKLQ